MDSNPMVCLKAASYPAAGDVCLLDNQSLGGAASQLKLEFRNY
jgi:hypothetical protein